MYIYTLREGKKLKYKLISFPTFFGIFIFFFFTTQVPIRINRSTTHSSIQTKLTFSDEAFRRWILPLPTLLLGLFAESPPQTIWH